MSVEVGVLAVVLIYALGIVLSLIAHRYSRKASRYIGSISLLAAIPTVAAFLKGHSLTYLQIPIFIFKPELVALYAVLTLALSLIMAGLDVIDPEYIILTLLASLGCFIVCFAASIVTLIIGIEAVAFSVAGLLTESVDKTVPARYLSASFFASSLVVFGCGLLWSQGYYMLGSKISATPQSSLGLALLIAGLAVEVGLAPFHIWIPDVAARASQLGLAVSSLAVDTPLLVTLYRIVSGAGESVSTIVASILAILSVSSMIIGELSALAQRNAIRRMVGFSIVSDAGYTMLLALAEAFRGGIGLWPAVYFASASGLALALVFASSNHENNIVYGLPLAAALLCLAGLPPLYGFAAKLVVIFSFFSAGMPMLALIAAVFFVVAATYNIRFVLQNAKIMIERKAPLPLNLYALLLVALGIMPGTLMYIAG